MECRRALGGPTRLGKAVRVTLPLLSRLAVRLIADFVGLLRCTREAVLVHLYRNGWLVRLMRQLPRIHRSTTFRRLGLLHSLVPGQLLRAIGDVVKPILLALQFGIQRNRCGIVPNLPHRFLRLKLQLILLATRCLYSGVCRDGARLLPAVKRLPWLGNQVLIVDLMVYEALVLIARYPLLCTARQLRFVMCIAPVPF